MKRLGVSFSWRDKTLKGSVTCSRYAEEAGLESVWMTNFRSEETRRHNGVAEVEGPKWFHLRNREKQGKKSFRAEASPRSKLRILLAETEAEQLDDST